MRHITDQQRRGLTGKYNVPPLFYPSPRILESIVKRSPSKIVPFTDSLIHLFGYNDDVKMVEVGDDERMS